MVWAGIVGLPGIASLPAFPLSPQSPLSSRPTSSAVHPTSLMRKQKGLQIQPVRNGRHAGLCAGVLVLSEFAGAAQSLGAGAILVNPWNITDLANAIDHSLTMRCSTTRLPSLSSSQILCCSTYRCDGQIHSTFKFQASCESSVSTPPGCAWNSSSPFLNVFFRFLLQT